MRRAFVALVLVAVSGGINNARPRFDERPMTRVIVIAASKHVAHADSTV